MVAVPSNSIAQRVEAIPGTPLPHGLLTAAKVLDAVDEHELNGVVWQPMSCAQAHTTFVCPPSGPPPAAKTFTNSGRAYGPAVTVYYGRTCPPIGESFDDAVAYAKAGLAIGEQFALEKWVWDNLFVPDGVDQTIVPGTAMSIQEGLGVLESALAQSYGGVGIIHIPMIASAPVGSDGHLLINGAYITTWAGNLVSFGAGYSNTAPTSGAAAPAHNAWIYATGPVILRREKPTTLPTMDNSAINVTINDRNILAERTWTVQVECVIEAVLVDLTT